QNDTLGGREGWEKQGHDRSAWPVAGWVVTIASAPALPRTPGRGQGRAAGPGQRAGRPDDPRGSAAHADHPRPPHAGEGEKTPPPVYGGRLGGGQKEMPAMHGLVPGAWYRLPPPQPSPVNGGGGNGVRPARRSA